MRVSVLLVILALSSALAPHARASTACTQVFAAASIKGVQYNVETTVGFPPPVVGGSIALNIQFRDGIENVVTPQGNISLRYTVDNQPISPVLTNDFAWTLVTTTIPDGTHALSVLYVNESTQEPCVTFIGRQYSFVVLNSHAITGAQIVPAIAPPQANGPVPPQFADFVSYSGTQSHATPHPFPAIVVPPAGGVEPDDLWAEPLLASTSNAGEPLPEFWKLPNGAIVEDPLFTNLLGCDDLRKPKEVFDSTGPVWELRKAHFDGLQDDDSLSSYSTFTANPNGPGFYGVSMDGRLFLLGTNGSLTTIAGRVTNRSLTPYDYLDGAVPIATVEEQETLLGSFDTPFHFPTDLAVDPNDSSHIYIADMLNHRVALADISQTPPVISTFAGVAGQAGYLDGPAGTALFDQPCSIAIEADGTMYVADSLNSVIRKIDTFGNVTTVVGLGPTGEPTTSVVSLATLTYAPRTAVPFASAYINYPNTVRLDSKGNLVLAETVTQAIRYLDLNAQTITTLAQFTASGQFFGEQVWLDVDRNGNIGGKDDIIATMAGAQEHGLFRIPITGTTAMPLPTITPLSTDPIYSGHTSPSSLPFTQSPWTVAIDDQEGRLVVTGIRSAGVVSLRLLQPSDPAFQFNRTDYLAGRAIWFTGTVPNFPFGSRPSFAAVHGYEGHSGLGNVLNFDDLVSMTTAQLTAYLQAGAQGSVPRPELTGNDLRNLIYYIQRTTTGGAQVTPGPTSTDVTPPVISAVAATEKDSTDVTATWTTSEAALGFVEWGTTSETYFGWSPIESAYATSHSVTLSNLPAGQTIYFTVVTKDAAGNQSNSPEQKITLQ